MVRASAWVTDVISVLSASLLLAAVTHAHAGQKEDELVQAAIDGDVADSQPFIVTNRWSHPQVCSGSRHRVKPERSDGHLSARRLPTSPVSVPRLHQLHDFRHFALSCAEPH